MDPKNTTPANDQGKLEDADQKTHIDHPALHADQRLNDKEHDEADNSIPVHRPHEESKDNKLSFADHSTHRPLMQTHETDSSNNHQDTDIKNHEHTNHEIKNEHPVDEDHQPFTASAFATHQAEQTSSEQEHTKDETQDQNDGIREEKTEDTSALNESPSTTSDTDHEIDSNEKPMFEDMHATQSEESPKDEDKNTEADAPHQSPETSLSTHTDEVAESTQEKSYETIAQELASHGDAMKTDVDSDAQKHDQASLIQDETPIEKQPLDPMDKFMHDKNMATTQPEAVSNDSPTPSHEQKPLEESKPAGMAGIPVASPHHEESMKSEVGGPPSTPPGGMPPQGNSGPTHPHEKNNVSLPLAITIIVIITAIVAGVLYFQSSANPSQEVALPTPEPAAMEDTEITPTSDLDTQGDEIVELEQIDTGASDSSTVDAVQEEIDQL